MQIPKTISMVSNKTLLAILAIGAVFVLVAGLLVNTVSANSLVRVESNIADVPGGDSLVVTVGYTGDDVYELEVDHSFQGQMPEFSLYASESNPYGTSGQDFVDYGISVQYSAANKEWVIDFGDDVTDFIRNNGNTVTFYYVLRDAARNVLWGTMDGPTPENTFAFDLDEGTGDTLFIPVDDEEVEDTEDDAIVPGVPNTATAK